MEIRLFVQSGIAVLRGQERKKVNGCKPDKYRCFWLIGQLTRQGYNGGMYVLATNLVTLPVISLQTGETVATIASLVIDSDRLKLVGLRLNVGKSPRNLLVMSGIRQLAADCVIIDNDEELSEPDDVVRLAGLLQSGYTPLSKRVQTDTGRHLGSVEDFTINLETEQVQKLYVHPPLVRAWYKSSVIIDRAQVIDVQPTLFIVRDTLEYSTNLATEPATVKTS